MQTPLIGGVIRFTMHCGGAYFVFEKVFGKSKYNEIETANIPVHVAIVMDGNGRWAKRRGLPRTIGHREGAGTLKKIVRFSSKMGIQYLTVYAFSTENWKRPKSEVDSLMSLLYDYLKNADKELAGEDVRIRIIGDTVPLNIDIQQEILRVERMTRNNKGMTLNIALNYGGRDEIVHAVKEIIKDLDKGRIKADNIDEQMITSRLYTSDIPDPDLIIRPSGEKRMSNFLLWQSAYSEFWYSDILWPDFDEKHFMEAIADYQKRERRFGGI